MFYLCNVSDWFSQIIHEMQENRLPADQSRYMIVLFSSMDFEMVEFFRARGNQVSAYSGENFHVFTPMLYDGGTIPDNEWRHLRRQFDALGVNLGHQAAAVVFSAVRSQNGKEERFIPAFIGAYHFPDGADVRRIVKGAIDVCVQRDSPNDQLARRLEPVFGTPNLINGKTIPWENTVIDEATRKLSMPTLFISHSSKDKPFVRKLADALIKEKVHVWIDENEIVVGDNIRKAIDQVIKGTDFFAFVVSKNSVSSEWVRYEVYNALSRMENTKLLPLVIDDAMHNLPDTMASLKELRYLDFTDSKKWKERVEELKKAIRGW